MNTVLQLIDQCITIAKAQDEELKEYYLAQHKASKTVGESSLVFHLKNLKELLTPKKSDTIQLAGKTLTVIEGGAPKKAFDVGYSDALLGKSFCSCPYEPNTSDSKEWRSGFEFGAYSATM